MKPPVERVKVSQRGKEILSNLKRKTGIREWHPLCRWALCASLEAKTPPKIVKGAEDSSIEIAWATFGGSIADVLAAGVAMRYEIDMAPEKKVELGAYFRAHLERGLSFLQRAKDLNDLLDWSRKTNGGRIGLERE